MLLFEFPREGSSGVKLLRLSPLARALACRAASTSCARFSSANFSRWALDKNLGYKEMYMLVMHLSFLSGGIRLLSKKSKLTFAAAASASFFLRISSSTLSGVAAGFLAPHPCFLLVASTGGGGGASSGGGGGATASGGGGGTAESSGGGGMAKSRGGGGGLEGRSIGIEGG